MCMLFSNCYHRTVKTHHYSKHLPAKVGDYRCMLDVTSFSDKAWFILQVIWTFRIFTYGRRKTSYEIRRYPVNIGVWCAVSRRRIFWPILSENNINSERYIDTALGNLTKKRNCRSIVPTRQHNSMADCGPAVPVVWRPNKFGPNARRFVTARFRFCGATLKAIPSAITEHNQHNCRNFAHGAAGSVYNHASSCSVMCARCWCTRSELFAARYIVNTLS
jgi:hypothetical protein